jgi:hypothetical protein
MAENIHSRLAGGDAMPSNVSAHCTGSEMKRRGVTRATPHAINGVLKWIEEAHAADRVWARNALVVVCVLTGLLISALRFGLLRA